ncbi:alkaline phosphatase-like [Macrobrachium nipponense]|uniref:alkaline phosphatase-like n=1 Tax=Macrobrachium nipponense TaxID=159736 RepID=UPI0030C8D38E
MRSFTILSLVALHLVLGVSGSPFHAKRYRKTQLEDQDYWNSIGQSELKRALGQKWNTNVAKNVILFLGDGMSIPTLTAARIYKGQLAKRGGEEGTLTFETFPHVGLSKTYNVNKQVADSASTATAYLTGVKTNYKTVGVDGSVEYNDCQTMFDSNKVYSIVKWAQDAGKMTGVVTSTRLTHATPAASYAHVPNRDWECDGRIKPEDFEKCPDLKDIARQLIEDEPGNSINVLMGGGYQNFDANATDLPNDPLDDDPNRCLRRDGRQLTREWQERRAATKSKHAFVRSRTDLHNVDLSDTEYLLGLFSNGHVPYEYEKVEKNLDIPTLAEMAAAAIKILKNGPNGYFLLVEGGRIDHGHHDTKAHRALDEAVAMDRAVEEALRLTSREDTLIVVTADHAHTMSISGYPARGQEIIGLAALGDDGLPYTTLMYANGPGYNYTIKSDDDDDDEEGNGDDDDDEHFEVSRWNVTQEEATAWDYTQLAAVPKNSETHGGDDVAIYAIGPMSHLFHTLHEQNYIAHAMAYAACIGKSFGNCDGRDNKITPPETHFQSTTLELEGASQSSSVATERQREFTYSQLTTDGGAAQMSSVPALVFATLTALWLRQ